METWINLLMSIKYNEEILSKAVMKHGPEILTKCLADFSSIEKYINTVYDEKLNYPIPADSINQDKWLIPKKYTDMDIVDFVLKKATTEVEYQRAALELELFKKHNMIDVLKTMVYVVDTLRENNIVWGVGRGSSVASYVLHIIGVHKINSIKYNIPIEEFFKGDQNG